MSLSLGDDRAAALKHAASIVARAWREFDSAREEEVLRSTTLVGLLREPLLEQPGYVLADLDLAADVLDASLA